MSVLSRRFLLAHTFTAGAALAAAWVTPKEEMVGVLLVAFALNVAFAAFWARPQ